MLFLSSSNNNINNNAAHAYENVWNENAAECKNRLRWLKLTLKAMEFEQPTEKCRFQDQHA